MPSFSNSADLNRAYLNTIYKIQAEKEICLRIGGVYPELAYLSSKNIPQGIGITSYNPFSRLLRPKQNQRKYASLVKSVIYMGFNYYLGQNVDQNGVWPIEKTIWIPDMPLNLGKSLAIRYRQNALIHSDINGLVKILWLR